jgi:hypothetical protein
LRALLPVQLAQLPRTAQLVLQTTYLVLPTPATRSVPHSVAPVRPLQPAQRATLATTFQAHPVLHALLLVQLARLPHTAQPVLRTTRCPRPTPATRSAQHSAAPVRLLLLAQRAKQATTFQALPVSRALCPAQLALLQQPPAQPASQATTSPALPVLRALLPVQLAHLPRTAQPVLRTTYLVLPTPATRSVPHSAAPVRPPLLAQRATLATIFQALPVLRALLPVLRALLRPTAQPALRTTRCP